MQHFALLLLSLTGAAVFIVAAVIAVIVGAVVWLAVFIFQLCFKR